MVEECELDAVIDDTKFLRTSSLQVYIISKLVVMVVVVLVAAFMSLHLD